MNFKDPNKDTGSYVNGVYTTKNGYTGTGLNCPKGTRLYNTENCPIFFLPDDLQPGEEFRMITNEVAPDIMPYYAVSNNGRVMNINTRKIMKPNYRPNGYEYLCLAANNSKTGQKKYTTHRMVLKTFDPRENMDELDVNHIYGDKTKNYINKVMEDGSIDTGIEWSTRKENCLHREQEGLSSHNKLNMDIAREIRALRDQGYSYQQIVDIYNGTMSSASVQHICLNQVYYDPDYIPKSYEDISNFNPGNSHRLTDEDAEKIRDLYNHGYKYEDIKSNFYPDFSIGTISYVVRKKTHNKDK